MIAVTLTSGDAENLLKALDNAINWYDYMECVGEPLPCLQGSYREERFVLSQAISRIREACVKEGRANVVLDFIVCDLICSQLPYLLHAGQTFARDRLDVAQDVLGHSTMRIVRGRARRVRVYPEGEWLEASTRDANLVRSNWETIAQIFGAIVYH